MIVKQEENYTQYLHYKIPKDWVVHNKPSGYMDRNGWMKEIIHFKNVCGENKLNPWVLFYDRYGSHFDNRAIHKLLSHHIKHLFLKADDSGNDHPNDYGENLKLKGIYGQVRMNW